MSIYSIYFSPTQGTKKITNLLADEWKDYQEIDLCEDTSKLEKEKKIFSEQDVCFFGVPSYGGRVPAVAVERIQNFIGNHAKAILVVAYGNRHYDDTLLELYHILKERDFQCVGAVTAIAEHSIMRQFGAGRPDEEDREQLKQFAKQIKIRVENPVDKEMELCGNIPYKEYHGVPLKPQTKEICNQCSVCANLCPVGAISLKEPNKTDKEKCISCMRCIQICPKHARELDQVMLNGVIEKMKNLFKERKKNELFLAG